MLNAGMAASHVVCRLKSYCHVILNLVKTKRKIALVAICRVIIIIIIIIIIIRIIIIIIIMAVG